MSITTSTVDPVPGRAITGPGWRRTAYELLQRGGAAAVLHRVARRLLRPVCTWVTYGFYERDVAIPASGGLTTKAPVEARVATAEDFERFQSVFDRAGVTPRKIEERRRNGDICFLGVSNGRLLHFAWLAVRLARIQGLGLTVRLRTNEAYGYNAYTVPEARGLGVQPAVAELKIAWEREHHVRYHISSVVIDNYSGRKIYERPNLPAARRGPTVRCFRFTGLRGRLLTGLRRTNGPHFEFPAGAVVRRLGPLGIWVVPPA